MEVESKLILLLSLLVVPQYQLYGRGHGGLKAPFNSDAFIHNLLTFGAINQLHCVGIILLDHTLLYLRVRAKVLGFREI